MTSDPTTRASLLLRLRDSQNQEAWVEFVALYESVVYRLLRKSGLQDADCHELMQEFFLSVSRNIERWDPATERGSFRGWLRRVTRNLVINWLKRRHRQEVPAGGSAPWEMFENIPANAERESNVFDRELRRAMFHRASELVRIEISASAWMAFWETTVAGLSPSVAGQKLGMSAGAVRVAKCRVIARLREIVTAMESES
jgi:RNA polymerase sigma-70 factor (ECF subfamily)